jgi:hypothetical protein
MCIACKFHFKLWGEALSGELDTILTEAQRLMATLATKSKILEDAGYFYNFDRQAYVNRKAKKIFSIEFVEDHSDKELQKRISEETQENGWRYYSNSEPSEAVKRAQKPLERDRPGAAQTRTIFPLGA